MHRILSTYRFSKQPLGPSLIGEIAQSEIRSIEIYCTPGHFNYRSQQAVHDLAGELGEHGVEVFALHSPTERDVAPGRESGVPISISDTERIRRIDAMDEVKRALEVAERIPLRFLVQHIGNGRQMADPRKFDAAFSSLEHLVVFAKARGVAIALENTPDELGSPSSLERFIRETHLHDLKLCFDTGHAHMDAGLAPSFEIMKHRVALVHLHDNHGEKDEHLLPWEGEIDWTATLKTLASAPEPVQLVLEVKDQPNSAPSLAQIRSAFDQLEKELGDQSRRAVQS
jgi:sugar phosphate isomerase/epimerase